jgi:pyrroloquinoline quinone biosynthesis protein D
MRSARPKLIRNCRLSESPTQRDTLVMPEGAIRLKGTGAEIVSLCDGDRSIDGIIEALKSKYPAVPSDQLESDTLEFLKTLREKRVLDF